MNLRDFSYLSAVAEHLHFGKAAKACNVSQPALSMQLRKLEDSLGVRLLERDKKQVRVTPAGEAILLRAKQMLLLAEEIKQAAKSFQDPLAGDFRLGAFPTLAPYYLPAVIPSLHKKLPKLNLLLVEEKTQRLLDMLKEGTLDAAFIALPVEDKDLASRPLFSDPFLLAVPNSHRLAKHKTVHIKDIAGEKLLLLEEGHCLRTQALEACSIVSGNEYKEFRATSLETLRQMVLAGVGVTLIPSSAADRDKSLAYIPFAKPAPSRTIGIVWRRNSPRATCVERIRTIVSAQ